MTEFVKVASIGELAPGERKLLDFEEATLALFNVDGKFYCIEDVCTHDGGPVAEGETEGFTIACPRHGALFDLRDGSVISMPAVVPLPTYRVKIEGDDIFVESPETW
jgi:3-phenylpropionate/trans-cinnamate dioxygenase ferredoxin subunit